MAKVESARPRVVLPTRPFGRLDVERMRDGKAPSPSAAAASRARLTGSDGAEIWPPRSDAVYPFGSPRVREPLPMSDPGRHERIP